LQQLIGTMRVSFDEGIVGVEEVIVEIAFEAVCKILGEAWCRPDGVLAAVREVIRNAREREQLLVHLAPGDHELVSRHRSSLLQNGDSGHIELVADERVVLGGCLVETSGGTLDGRLETQLQRLRDTLLDVNKMRLEGGP
jgi:flagellar assembly protein FliH